MSSVNTRSGSKKKSTPNKASLTGKQKKCNKTPSDISVKNLVDECRENEREEREITQIEILRDVAGNFKSLADVVSNHTQKINNMEEYLSRFENLFMEFQKSMVSQIDVKLKTFENTLKKTIATQTAEIKTFSRRKPDNNNQDVNSNNIIEDGELTATLQSIKEAAETIKYKNKEEKAVKKARKYKNLNFTDWNKASEMRRKYNWGHVMNKKKAELYTRWQEETPQFIPRKFRPKKSPGEIPEITKMNIEHAYNLVDYNIKEMHVFAAYHEEKLKDIDVQMCSKIDASNLDEDVKGKTKDLWYEETEDSQDKSLNLWQKKENFLSKKRHEELELGLEKCQLSEITWDEVLKSRANNTYRSKRL